MMMSQKFARCSPVTQLRKCYNIQDFKWQVMQPLRTWSHKSLCKVGQVRLIPVRHIFKRQTVEGVSFKPAHKADGVSGKYQLIFYNSLTRYMVYGVRAIYVVSIFAGASLTRVLIGELGKESSFKSEEVTIGQYTVEDPFYFCVTGIPTLILGVLGILVISRNVPLRIYRDKSTKRYAARMLKYGLFEKTIKFNQQDIFRLNSTSMWTGNVSIAGRRVLIFEGNFKTVGDFNCFMGYDYERASDLEKVMDSEDVMKIMKKGVKHHQDLKYKSFEQKYLEKRKRNIN